MASRIIHLAITNELIKKYHFKNVARLKFGTVLPDAYATGKFIGDCTDKSTEITIAGSHFKISVCGNNKRTYDFTRFRTMFLDLMKKDDLYLGYYLHLIQDILFRHFVYDEYHWNPTVPGNVERLHRDYAITNYYIIQKYGVRDDVEVPDNFEKEPICDVYPFEPYRFLREMKEDFKTVAEKDWEEDIFFFTREMADEYIQRAVLFCMEELRALKNGEDGIDEYEYAWKNTPRVLLKTTLNTRELGGFRIRGEKAYTRFNRFIRSDIQKHPSEEDMNFLRRNGITTIIDMRGSKDVMNAPSGFAEAEGFEYHNIPIDEGSGVPESVEAVPASYVAIATAKNMPEVFRLMATAKTGVMFNCTAGKDRTGVVSALILWLCGVSREDILFDYMLTKECNRERFELIQKNYPEIDMNIIIPNESNMERFMDMIEQRYGSVQEYFAAIGITEKEQKAIRDKLMYRAM